MATRIEPLHPWWILLAALLLWFLATSVASASGWEAEEGVRYRTYRSGAAAPPPLATPAAETIHPWLRLGVAEEVDVWVAPWLLDAPGFAPFAPLVGFPGSATTAPAPAGGAGEKSGR